MSQVEYESIWIPRVEFLHLKMQRPIMEGSKEEIYALTTYPDFRIYYSELTSTTLNCPMDFSSFPFDHHVCYVEVSVDILPTTVVCKIV